MGIDWNIENRFLVFIAVGHYVSLFTVIAKLFWKSQNCLLSLTRVRQEGLRDTALNMLKEVFASISGSSLVNYNNWIIKSTLVAVNSQSFIVLINFNELCTLQFGFSTLSHGSIILFLRDRKTDNSRNWLLISLWGDNTHASVQVWWVGNLSR